VSCHSCVAQVGAGAEGAIARASKNDDPGVIVGREVVNRPVQIDQHVGGQRVEASGVVDDDPPDATVEFGEDSPG
jgi:hypothetical protein